jgi:hypothetical protein
MAELVTLGHQTKGSIGPFIAYAVPRFHHFNQRAVASAITWQDSDCMA